MESIGNALNIDASLIFFHYFLKIYHDIFNQIHLLYLY